MGPQDTKCTPAPSTCPWVTTATSSPPMNQAAPNSMERLPLASHAARCSAGTPLRGVGELPYCRMPLSDNLVPESMTVWGGVPAASHHAVRPVGQSPAPPDRPSVCKWGRYRRTIGSVLEECALLEKATAPSASGVTGHIDPFGDHPPVGWLAPDLHLRDSSRLADNGHGGGFPASRPPHSRPRRHHRPSKPPRAKGPEQRHPSSSSTRGDSAATGRDSRNSSPP